MTAHCPALLLCALASGHGKTSITADCRALAADGREGEAVYLLDSIVASCVHWYFPSNPQCVARWFLGEE